MQMKKEEVCRGQGGRSRVETGTIGEQEMSRESRR